MDELEKLMNDASNGDRDATWKIGDFYREAKLGTRYSPKLAFRWYAESALAGNPTGQNNVGAAYENGVGCQQSYAKAAKWYRLSAAQGCGVAMANLGFLYLYGFGVKPDRSVALDWFKRAAALGCPRSKRILKTVRADD